MGKRLKMNLVLVTAVLLVSGALVTSTGVTAQALQACTTSPNSFTLTPKPDGGNWPIPTTSDSGNVPLFRWDYLLSATPGVDSVEVALNKQIKVVQKSDGVTNDANLQAACAGGTASNADFGKDLCDIRIYKWPTVTATLSFYTQAVPYANAHGPIGGCSVSSHEIILENFPGPDGLPGPLLASAGDPEMLDITLVQATTVGTGSPLEVPIPAPPAFASVPTTDVVEVDGVQYCIPLGPTGCPTGDPPFLCSNPSITLPPENLTVVDSNNVSHVPKWFQGTAENPACTRGQFFINATCHYIYIGGTPYKVC